MGLEEGQGEASGSRFRSELGGGEGGRHPRGGQQQAMQGQGSSQAVRARGRGGGARDHG